MEWERDRPQEVYLASQFVKDLDDVVKELAKGIPEES